MDKWWIIFLFSYLLPLLQIIFGILFKIFPPKFQNGAYGFYSARCVKSEKSWNFAQQRFSANSLKCGIIVLAMALFLHYVAPINVTISNFINVLLGLTSFVFSYTMTQKSLKKDGSEL